MKKSIIISLHTVFWIGYCLLLLLFLGLYFQGELPNKQLDFYFGILFGFAFIPAIFSFYSGYFIVFPRYIQQQRILPAIFVGLLLSFCSAMIGVLILSTVVHKSHNYTFECFIQGIPPMTFIAICAGMVGLVIKGFITWYEELKLKEALKQKNHEMEMALVKAQLDPHFLFNTINNIDVLILKNANQASDYLNKLSDIMRFMLFETKTEEILLAQEVEYIKKYIELQKIRTANETYVNFAINGTPNGQTIAPMVFIPFIENAFKHTTNKKLENAIDIQIHLEKETIILECINKLDGRRSSLVESNGLGNELIIKRLQLIYPNRHTLNISKENDLYSVHLTIQK